MAIEVALHIVPRFVGGGGEPNIPGTPGVKNDALSDHLDGQLRRDSPLDTGENPPLRTASGAASVMS
ncbi:hypothetical protein [Streptomyces sp. NPDC058773]|uniref:hypothetical protein n=1 Tax=Streptomyces sp. NPDC058773 TaxID=3346632 RepID=UPI0036AE1594